MIIYTNKPKKHKNPRLRQLQREFKEKNDLIAEEDRLAGDMEITRVKINGVIHKFYSSSGCTLVKTKPPKTISNLSSLKELENNNKKRKRSLQNDSLVAKKLEPKLHYDNNLGFIFPIERK